MCKVFEFLPGSLNMNIFMLKFFFCFAEWLTENGSLIRSSCPNVFCKKRCWESLFRTFSPLHTSDTLRAGFTLAQNPSSDFFEWSCARAIRIKTSKKEWWICTELPTSVGWTFVASNTLCEKRWSELHHDLYVLKTFCFNFQC